MALKYPFYRLRGSENFHFPLVYKMKTISLFEKNQLNLVFVCKYLLNECIPALNGHILRYLEKIPQSGICPAPCVVRHYASYFHADMRFSWIGRY